MSALRPSDLARTCREVAAERLQPSPPEWGTGRCWDDCGSPLLGIAWDSLPTEIRVIAQAVDATTSEESRADLLSDLADALDEWQRTDPRWQS